MDGLTRLLSYGIEVKPAPVWMLSWVNLWVDAVAFFWVGTLRVLRVFPTDVTLR